MTIPDYQTLMLPMLQSLADGAEHSLRELIDDLAVGFNLTDQERKELLPSGRQAIFSNRVGWARTYLKKAGLIEPTKRACFKITERGVGALEKKPDKITNQFLDQYPEFLEFRGRSKERELPADAVLLETSQMTPEESLEHFYQKIKQDLAQELLGQIKACSPEFFETLVVELLVKMGYGGSRKDAGQAIGKSGDGGIDGIIKEDKLGLDVIYIQAKRWEGTVSRPEIQKFVGALHGQRARKGVFITSSSFSKEAAEYVSRIEPKIVLIDGAQLTQFMIDFGIGVSAVSAYEVNKIDSDYFSD